MSDESNAPEPLPLPAETRTRAIGRLIYAAVGVSVVMVLVGGVVGYVLPHHRSTPAHHAASRLPIYIEWRNLEPGDCTMELNRSRDIGDLRLVPCSQSHQLEVFAAFFLPDGPYPGEQTLRQLAYNGCGTRFESYVGIAPADSTIDFSYFYPSSTAWRFNHWAKCLLVTDGGHVGSLQGTKK